MTEPPSLPPGVRLPFSPMSSLQYELQEKAIKASDMLEFALQRAREALDGANIAREAVGLFPTADLLAGALTVGDLKMREAISLLEIQGEEAVEAIRALFSVVYDSE